MKIVTVQEKNQGKIRTYKREWQRRNPDKVSPKCKRAIVLINKGKTIICPLCGNKIK